MLIRARSLSASCISKKLGLFALSVLAEFRSAWYPLLFLRWLQPWSFELQWVRLGTELAPQCPVLASG